MTFKITKKGSNNFWHTYNNNSKVVNLSDFEVVLDYASQTFSISMPNGANVPNIAVEVADVIVLDETGANVNEIFANVEALRVRLVALGYTPYVISNGGGIQSIQEGTNITVDNTDPLNPIVSATGGGASQNLQQVTDVGNTTTNAIFTGNIMATDINGGEPPFAGVYNGANGYLLMQFDDTDSGFSTNFSASPLTAGNSIVIPDASGTIALTTDVTNKVPYTGATQDVNLGEFGLLTGNIEFDNTPTNIPTTAGSMVWNDTDGTLDLKLKGGNVTLQIGQEQVLRVVNKTATNVNLLEANYQAVRVTGAQGQRLKVDLAQATTDSLSAETIGLVTETINDNQEGFITTSGLIRGVNTTGSLQSETWADGDILYLSPTIAGQVTKVKPVAPNHLVIIGYVVSAHATQGSIFVKVDNGYELDELHNVKIDTPLNNNILAYTSATEIWENKTVATALGFTPANDSAVVHNTGDETIAGEKTFTGTVISSNINGGNASGGSLNIEPTSNATKGVVKVSVLGAGATSGGFSVGTANPNLNKIPGDSDHMVNIVNNGTALQSVQLYTYGSVGLLGQNNVHFNRLRGTEAIPTAVQSGDTGVSFGIRYRDNVALGQSSSSFANVATENHTTIAHGSEWRFGATPNGSITRAHVLTVKSNALHISPNNALTPYRTTTNLVLDGASSGYTGDFRALIQSDTTNGAGIILGNSTTQEAYIVRYGSSYSGNFAGTSVAFASVLSLRSGPTANQNFVQSGANIVNLIGATSTNLATRLNNAGFKIGTLADAHTDGTAYLHISKAGTATAGTAPLKLTSGTNLTTPENGAFEFDGTNLYFTVGGVRKTVTLI